MKKNIFQNLIKIYKENKGWIILYFFVSLLIYIFFLLIKLEEKESYFNTIKDVNIFGNVEVNTK